MFQDRYDVVVIGGGHAGCEAALAAARMGRRTLLLTLGVDATALMPCNPSIGGPAKGHLVREVSALGGEQARAADASTLMIRWLNTSKGVAVRALRAQCDPARYAAHYRGLLYACRNLDLHQDEAVELSIDGSRVRGVLTRHGSRYEARAVVLCSGTYLGGRVYVGEASFPSGPMGQMPAERLLNSLKALGLRLGYMRTDTPPRLNLDTLDLSSAAPQRSEEEPLCFDIWGEKRVYRSNYACWFSRTTERTHEILERSIHRSPLVTGMLEALGPRYCPSIEDKFLRFPDRRTHPIVFEPVSADSKEVYVQNFSTSLPYDVQVEMVRSLPGCAEAKVVRPGYGIRYAYLTPDQLSPSLENREPRGFFCAGQVNGTSGYEEAAAQGLLAGINAALSVKGEPPLVLSRSDGYLGVLADDLTTKSTDEPYRMLTSRCEHRLLMRHDNAARRLSPLAHRLGLLSPERWAGLERRWECEDREVARLESIRIVPSEETDRLCKASGAEPPKESLTAAAFLRHRGATYPLVEKLIGEPGPQGSALEPDSAFYVETSLRYAGYLEKEARLAERMAGLDGALVPEGFDYAAVKGLSSEGRQKLLRFRPRSLGAALRISGVTPADVQLLSVVVRRMGGSSASREGAR